MLTFRLGVVSCECPSVLCDVRVIIRPLHVQIQSLCRSRDAAATPDFMGACSGSAAADCWRLLRFHAPRASNWNTPASANAPLCCAMFGSLFDPFMSKFDRYVEPQRHCDSRIYGSVLWLARCCCRLQAPLTVPRAARFKLEYRGQYCSPREHPMVCS
ncbi:hypothetical protein B0H14DRAFT_3430576 [Mycena olivaceomarginata]|nr:hypothetical protein B0H14DRAFT_3430576 [Mycena olivaceomarginata]